MFREARIHRVTEAQTRLGAAAFVLVFLGGALMVRTERSSSGFALERVVRAGSWGYPQEPFVAFVEVRVPWRFSGGSEYSEPIAFRLEDGSGRQIDSSDIGPGSSPTTRVIGVYGGYLPEQSNARLVALSKGDRIWAVERVALPKLPDRVPVAHADSRVSMSYVRYAQSDLRGARSGLQVRLGTPVPADQFAVVRIRQTSYQKAFPSRSFPFRCIVPDGERDGIIYLPNPQTALRTQVEVDYLKFRNRRIRLKLSGVELQEINGKPVFRVLEEQRVAVPDGPVVIIPRQYRPPRSKKKEPYRVADLTIWVQPPAWAWDDGNRAFGFGLGGIRPMYHMRLLGPSPQDLNIHGIRSVFQPYPMAKKVSGPVREGPVDFDVELNAEVPYRSRNFALAVPVEKGVPGQWVADKVIGTNHAPQDLRARRRAGIDAVAEMRGGGR